MPPEYTTSGGYGSPLRRAPFNGPPRSGRHQPLLSISPPVFVHITGDSRHRRQGVTLTVEGNSRLREFESLPHRLKVPSTYVGGTFCI